MSRQLFVNLPVKNLEKSKEFFTTLGFTFNPQFTDDKGACMIIDEGHVYAMLISESFYETFITKDIADASKTSEVIISLTCDSREQVDEMIANAVAAGAITQKSQDLGWMYQKGFLDLDGHHREIFFMDMSKMPQQA